MNYFSHAYCRNCKRRRPVGRLGMGNPLPLLVVATLGLVFIPWNRRRRAEIKDWRCMICEATVELDGESPRESTSPPMGRN